MCRGAQGGPIFGGGGPTSAGRTGSPTDSQGRARRAGGGGQSTRIPTSDQGRGGESQAGGKRGRPR
eukprot:12480422-Heterocapsa_arctica.AAC.1